MLFRDVPWKQGALLFAIDFGVIVAGWTIENAWVRGYFGTNLLGDPIGLPMIAFGEVLTLRSLPRRSIKAWYTSRGYYAALAAGLTVGWAGFTYFVEHGSGDVILSQYLAPSKAWHTVAWPAFAFMVLAPAPAVIVGAVNHRKARRGLAIALGGLAIWTGSAYYDFAVKHQPLGALMEFSPGQFARNLLVGRPFSGPSAVRVRRDLWRKSGEPWPQWFRDHYNSDGTPRR